MCIAVVNACTDTARLKPSPVSRTGARSFRKDLFVLNGNLSLTSRHSATFESEQGHSGCTVSCAGLQELRFQLESARALVLSPTTPSLARSLTDNSLTRPHYNLNAGVHRRTSFGRQIFFQSRTLRGRLISSTFLYSILYTQTSDHSPLACKDVR